MWIPPNTTWKRKSRVSVDSWAAAARGQAYKVHTDHGQCHLQRLRRHSFQQSGQRLHKCYAVETPCFSPTTFELHIAERTHDRPDCSVTCSDLPRHSRSICRSSNVVARTVWKLFIVDKARRRHGRWRWRRGLLTDRLRLTRLARPLTRYKRSTSCDAKELIFV